MIVMETNRGGRDGMGRSHKRRRHQQRPPPRSLRIRVFDGLAAALVQDVGDIVDVVQFDLFLNEVARLLDRHLPQRGLWKLINHP